MVVIGEFFDKKYDVAALVPRTISPEENCFRINRDNVELLDMITLLLRTLMDDGGWEGGRLMACLATCLAGAAKLLEKTER